MNALKKVWSALSDASNALGECEDGYESASARWDWLNINESIDHATRLVIARIEKDEQAFAERD